MHALNFEPFERRLDLFALMPRHDDDGLHARGQRLLGGDAHQRTAADLREQLVRPAHAGRAAGREDDRRDAPSIALHRLIARLRPRHDLHEQPADAHAGDVGARHRQSGKEPHQHPIEAVFLRRARATRRSDHGLAAHGADQHQVAGIDRHAEVLDPPADRFHRGGNHVAPVGNRRRAEHHNKLRASVENLVQRLRQRSLIVRHAALGDDARSGRSQPLLGDFQSLVNDLGRKPRQHRGDHTDLFDLVRRDTDEGRLGNRHCRVARSVADRKRDDLDRRDHLAGHHRLERRQGGKRDGLIDLVKSINAVLVDDQHAGAFREQIGPSGESAVDLHALPRHCCCNRSRSFVFRHVTALEFRDHDLQNTGRFQRLDLGWADQRALLEHQRVLANGVHRGRTQRLVRRDRAEFHAASVCRNCAVISPMIATAISAGEIAPISSPIGEWMRPISLSENPRSSLRRVTRRA